MKAFAWLLAGIVWALAAVPAQARPQAPAPAGRDDAAGVRGLLAQPAVLRGTFEQRKQLKGFRNPLVSRGAFLLLRDRGVAWDTTEPFASSTLLTRERLLTRLPDGSQRVVLDATASPGMAAVNSLLMALVAGDVDTLSTQFHTEQILSPGGGWMLRLLPREAALRRVFTRITLRGDRFVREVEIEEAAGDLTSLRFLTVVDQPAAPTAAEAARFD